MKKNILKFRKLLSDFLRIAPPGFLSKIRIVRQYFLDYLKRRSAFPIDFVGNNWNGDGTLPVAVLFGFNPWKRQVVSAYLNQYKTAFVLGNSSFGKVKSQFLSELPVGQEVVFVGWGRKMPWQASLYMLVSRFFGNKKIKKFTLEDGFLRSLGVGLLHSRPASLCIDQTGIYFDANRPSELEVMLGKYDFDAEPAILERARQGIQLMRLARLTKYYNLKPYPDSQSFKRTNNYSILVIGQVEDDASVLSGKAKITKNEKLVMQAKMDFPDADIYFRPHPDYWTGNRKGGRDSAELKKICAIVPPKTSLYDLFEVVDHVYTITSLAGFEALLYGLKVTTFGAPFYSNWGLTEDRVKIYRRRKKLSLEEIFACAYLVYPKYIHMESDESSTFERTASYFIVEALKHDDIFSLDQNRLFANALKAKSSLSQPFHVMCYLYETGAFAAADTNNVIEMLVGALRLSDYPQVSYLLSKTSNYDALVRYSNICIGYLADNVDKVIINTTLLEHFLYALSLSLSNSNGRVINGLPNINSSLVRLASSDDNFSGIIKNYIRCLSCNLQYDVIDDFLHCATISSNNSDRQKALNIHWSLADVIHEAMSFNISVGHYRSLCQVLLQKPTRSERNFSKRHQLTIATADQYISRLDKKYTTSINTLFNRVQYWALLDDDIQAAKEFKAILAVFSFEYISSLLSVGSEHEFKKRLPELISLGLFFIKNSHFDLADKIISLTSIGGGSASQLAALKLSLYKAKRDRGSFFDCFDQLSSELKSNEKILGIYARFLREIGLFEKSRLCYSELATQAKTLAKRVSVEAEIDKIEFCQQSSYILNSSPQPALPKGVIFLASQTCFNTLAMMVPSLVELKKKGYAVVNLIEGMTQYQPTGIEFIDQFSGIIPLELSFSDMINEWEVDWSNRRVVSNGINFYQGFYERISTYVRRFYVDLNAPIEKKSFFDNLARADTCLYVCNKIYSELVSRGMPMSFVSGNSHVTPFSVFRDFARHKNHPLLNFINCNVAYESYFSNLGSKFANTMCVTDMTLFPNIRAPFMARKDQFDRWFEKNKDDPAIVEKAKSLINVNRVGSSSDAKELEIIEFIKAQKSLGKKIVCAFGKVPVDLNVPYDGGPAHADMADWISHTVEVCGKSDRIILLVKPHPHELRPEIALDLVESFHDLIAVDTPENVLLLGHKDINGHALAPYLDLAILYNGSSGLELAAQGIPVVMASYFGKHDYPVDLNYPLSRAQYEEFLLSLDYPVPSEEIRKKAAFLICYLGTDEISILNQYSLRQLTNDKIGVPRWRKEKIDHFLESGDPKMELIADRIVEKFEMARV